MNTQNDKNSSVRYTIKYAFLHGMYWPVYCASCSFAAVFLLSRDFSNAQIGVLLAFANVIAVFLQPAIATFADTTTKISLHKLTALVAGIAAAFTLVLCLIPASLKPLLSVLLILELALLFSLQPLCNALGMQTINNGVSMNFGLGRGIGSLCFSIFSPILGVLIDSYGADAAPISAVFLFVLFILAAYTFKVPGAKTGSASAEHLPQNDTPDSQSMVCENPDAPGVREKPLGALAFARKYKKFVVLVLAATLTFCGHMYINNYFIQIVEAIGGNTKTMGTAISLAALVELPAMALFMPMLKKIRCSTILKAAFFFFFIKAGLTLLATSMVMIYIAQLFQFFSYAFFIPASVYYVNQVIGASDLVKGQAFMTGAVTLGGVLASLSGGVILDGPGVHFMLLIGTVVSVLGLVLCIPSIEKSV